MKKYVYDGKEVFNNYYWSKNDCIVEKNTKKIITPPKSINELKMIVLKDDQGKLKRRSFNKLRKFSHAKRYLPKNFDQFIDVYGWQRLYCFDPNRPTRVWSKTNMRFKKILKNQRGYLFFRAGKGTVYLHVMVFQSINKMKIDTNKFQLHHIDKDVTNCKLSNLKLVTELQHIDIHKAQKALKKAQELEN